MKKILIRLAIIISVLSILWYLLEGRYRVMIENYRVRDGIYYIKYYDDIEKKSNWYEVDKIQFNNLKKIGWFKYEK